MAAALRKTAVGKVNDLAKKISGINSEIRVARAQGRSVNSLLDERDRKVNELATWVDIDPASQLAGSDPLLAAGGALIIGEATSSLSVETQSDGSMQLVSSTGQRGIEVRSGRLAGLMESSVIAASGIASDFNDWAGRLIQSIDTIQATGIGLRGPATPLTGQRQISGIDVPLAAAQSLFELHSGELTITVTNPGGQRTSTVISVDTSVSSLRDIVSGIDGIAGIRASVSDSGTVSIAADAGYTFDFSGRPDQRPFVSAISGTSSPAVSGVYLGSGNDTWNVETIAGGKIGVSPNVILRVTSVATGEVIGELNVGQGYPANQPIEIADGIELTLPTGTLNAGDTFSLRVTAQPDETGLLASLGIQSFFGGNSLRDLRVSPDLSSSPALLAASRTGSPGDGLQLNRIIDFRSQAVFAEGSGLVEDRLASITSHAGILTAAKQLEIDQRDSRQLQLESNRDAVSGVDPNEELLEMMQYQRAFQAASRFVSTINNTLDDLMNLIGR